MLVDNLVIFTTKPHLFSEPMSIYGSDINPDVGRKLRLRRTMLGMSQEAVAKAIGITFQQVQKYEKGTNAMNANRLYQFAQLLSVPIAYFFEELEQSKPELQRSNNFETNPTHNWQASDRESLELMKSFKCIKEPVVRKRISDLVRGISSSD